MTRLRSRQAETEDVVPRRLKRGAVKRQHIDDWAVGQHQLAPGVVGDTHLHPTALERIRDVAAEAPGRGELVSVRATDIVVPAGGSLVEWAVTLGDQEGFATLALPTDAVPVAQTGYYRATVALEWEDWFGGNVWVAVDGEQRFPPGIASPWSAPADSYARTFEGSGEVLIESGQRLGVFVDHGDAAPHTLSRVLAQLSLVEAVGGARRPVLERVWNVRQQNALGHEWSGYPTTWTDPDAWWVWKYALGDDEGPVGNEAPGGTMDAYALVTVSSATEVLIEATADDSYVLSLNGAPVTMTTVDTEIYDWRNRFTASVTLPPGMNRLDVTATNQADGVGPGGASPAGFLFSMRRTSDNVVILRSHQDDWSLA